LQQLFRQRRAVDGHERPARASKQSARQFVFARIQMPVGEPSRAAVFEDRSGMLERQFWRSARSSWTRFMTVSYYAIDEIAVEIEITDEWIDLRQRQRHRRSTFE
jgi:hypothetical protein